jgi:prepilin-type N-terminal cleavage/methylation domain-containing protein
MDSRCSGFTLVEVLLAMMITSVLILGVQAAYRQAHQLWSRVEDERPLYSAARVLTETLRTELSGLYLPPVQEGQGPQSNDASFRLQSLPDGTVELAFHTLAPAWYGDVASSRMAKVLYRFSKDQDTGQTLLRRVEQPCAGEKIIGLERSDTVATGLSAFGLWAVAPDAARSKGAFQPVYESKERPPKAIKVVITWPGTKDVPETTFETLFVIPCEGQLQASGSNPG